MKKLLVLSLLAGTMLFSVSCGDDEPVNLDPPAITDPVASTVQIGKAIDINFAYTAKAGFKSSSVSATGGTATIKTDGTADAEAGTIVVTFTANATAGAGSVVLTVTDNEDDTQQATAVVSISLSPIPAITGIGATASATVGNTYSISGITVSSEDAFDNWKVEIVGGEVLVDEDISAQSSPYTATFSNDIDIETNAGTIELKFTVTDSDGDEATFTQALTLEYPVFEEVLVSGNITTNTTWTADKIYILEGKTFVESGAVLTINKGTIIKGQTGTGANATGLYAARGGKIEAVGSPTEPIIFTTVLDDIFPGRLTSPNLDKDDTELWGGVVLLGNAPISVSGDGTEAQIEGVPASETLGLYGGNVAADDSGELQYISIRHGGTTIDPAAGKDINGLTLGGVGTGTVIKNIEIFANSDDGIELFGGTVNISNLMVAHQGDDGIDIDQSYAGTISNFLLIHSGSKDGLEFDGPEGSMNDSFTLQNGVIHSTGTGRGATFKSKAMGTVKDVKWTGWTGGPTVYIRASYENSCADAKSDTFVNLTDASASNKLTFSNVEFEGGLAVSVFTDSEGCTVKAADQTAAEGKIVNGSAAGLTDAAVWNGWTLSDNLGMIPAL